MRFIPLLLALAMSSMLTSACTTYNVSPSFMFQLCLSPSNSPRLSLSVDTWRADTARTRFAQATKSVGATVLLVPEWEPGAISARSLVATSACTTVTVMVSSPARAIVVGGARGMLIEMVGGYTC